MELITTNNRAQAVQVATERKPWTDILTKYTPAHIPTLLTRPASVIVARPAPTLASLFKQYGHPAPMDYITACLKYTAEAVGVEFENSIQLIATANGLYNSCYGWTLAEILAFFSQFIAGRYGRFYGRFDNAIIYEALQRFWRAEVLPARQAKERAKLDEQRAQWAKDAITPEEFCRRNNLPENLTVAEIVVLMNERAQADNGTTAANG